MQQLDIMLAVAGETLALLLFIALVRQREYRTFVFFFAYIVCNLVAAGARLFVFQTGDAYLRIRCYWSIEAIYGLLALLAVLSALLQIRSVKWSRWWGYMLPVSASLTIIPTWISVQHPISRYPTGHLLTWVYVWLIECCLIELAGLFLVVVGNVFFSWAVTVKQFAVLAAFGISSGFTLAGYISRYYFGARFDLWFRYLPSGAFLGCLLVWLACFTNRETLQDALRASARLLEKRQRTDRAAKRLITTPLS